MERTRQIDWLPVLQNLTPISWKRLSDPEFVDHYIWVIYPYPQKAGDGVTEEILRVVGWDQLNDEWAVVVKNWDNDIFIILEEGKGVLWEAYEIIEHL